MADFGKNDRDAGGGGEHVHHAAEECAERGEQAFASSATERAGENVKHSGSGSDGQQNRGTQENKEASGIEHVVLIVAAAGQCD